MFTDLESLPGVSAVTGSSYAPFQEDRNVSTATIDGKPVLIENRGIWPNYFEAVGGRFVEGRSFTAKETSDGARVIVINKSMARRFWPNETAIDKHVDHVNSYDTLIGVTDDVRQLGLGVTPPPMYYTPMTTESTFTVLIRTSQNPMNIAPAVRERIRSIDDNIAIDWIQPMEELVRRSFAEERYRTLLITTFALIAVFLALIGLYGVMSRYVAYRNRELGIRLAIGAQPRRVLALILFKGSILTAAGISIGCLGALGVDWNFVQILIRRWPARHLDICGSRSHSVHCRIGDCVCARPESLANRSRAVLESGVAHCYAKKTTVEPTRKDSGLGYHLAV
jgi:putative ABC transport system permease protein